jgi:hypothetical protein
MRSHIFFLLLALIGGTNSAIANPFPWLDNSQLWWSTDPNTTPIITQQAVTSTSRPAQANQSLCTLIYLPTDSAATGVEARVQINGTTWAAAHWGTRTPAGPSKYVNAVPAANGAWHKLSVNLATGLSSPVAVGNSISGASWAMFNATGGPARVWWDTSLCTLTANEIGPVFTFPGGNPQTLDTNRLFDAATAYTCSDNKDPSCNVTINAFLSGGLLEGTSTFTYSATDSDGNTSVAVLQVIRQYVPTNRGFAHRDVWLDSNWPVTQTEVADLRNLANFPNTPQDRDLITVTDASQDQAWSSCGSGVATSNCGQRMYGYIVPPVTGTYTFYLSADRSGEFWLNRTGIDQDRSKMQKIAEVLASQTNLYTDLATSTTIPTRTAGGEWNNTTRPGYVSSAFTAGNPIVLTAGKPYFFEALAKNAAGGWQQLRLAWEGVASNPAQANVAFDYIRDQNLAAVASFVDTARPTINLISNPAQHVTGTPYVEKAVCVDNVPIGCIITVTGWGGMSQSNPVAGSYTLTLRATDKAGNTATATRTVTVAANGGFALGSLTLNRWNVPGTGTGAQSKVGQVISTASLIPFTAGPEVAPELSVTTQSFQIVDQNNGDLKGYRLHGFLHPRVSGNHRFWIAGDQDVELYINYDANNNLSDTKLWNNAAELTKVASYCNAATNWSYQYEWYKETCQQSVNINLQVGKVYYIALIGRERYNSDHMAVAWQEPTGGVITTAPPTDRAAANQATWIIPGSVLSPIQ